MKKAKPPAPGPDENGAPRVLAPTVLARLVASLRLRDWTAVTVELVIVILGVFIGLQVNNWSAAEADKRRGAAYAERLISDLERDLGQRRRLVEFYDAVYASAERTDALLAGPLTDPTGLVIHAYQATELVYLPPTRAGWDEVVSSGEISLLPRAATEGGLADYFNHDTRFGTLEILGTSPYRRRVRGLLPHAVQTAIRERCLAARDGRRAVVSFRPDCDLGISDAEIIAAAQALRNDPELWPELRNQFSGILSVRSNLQGDIAFLEGALLGLKGEPGSARGS